VRAHTARLLAATPSLRASWLLAIVAALAFTVLAADAGPRGTLLFLTLAPILPLAGVALAYGPQVDRLHELGAAAPLSGFRLLLLRSAAVVATTTLLAGGAGLFLPGAGGVAAAWLLPALALSLLTLALSARLEPVQAAGGLAAGWVAVVISAQREAGGEAALAEGDYAAFGVTGQLICLSLALACAAVLVLARRHYAAVLGRTA
jgi:hypothetical protein